MGPTKVRRAVRAKSLLGLGVVVMMCACTDTSVATRSAAPNGLVDIGGRKLEISCRGSGRPVVVLENGLGNTLDVWSQVMDRLAEVTTVCASNRAGLGLSDPRPAPHGASSAVDDLHALLAAAHLPSPYVIVGASFGGLDAQLFARRFPDQVRGVVLVDAISPGWDRQLEAILSPAQVAERRAIPNGEDMTNEDIRASEDLVAAGPPFPAKPLVVLRHGMAFPGERDWPIAKVEALWTSLQESLAALSPRSALLVAAASGHRIHQTQPDLVVDAVRAEIDPSRWPPTTTTPAAFGSGAKAAPAGALFGHVIFPSSNGVEIASAAGNDRRVLVGVDSMTPGEPSIDAGGQVLAFTRRISATPAGASPSQQPTEVWVLDIPTGATTRVAEDGSTPAISPDGHWIAYGHLGHTYLIHPDGTGLTDVGEGGCTVWSPDSSQLAMCTNDDAVFLLRVSDRVRHSFMTGKGPNEPTAWSPDGATLALVSQRDGNGEIYVVGIEDHLERRLTTAPGSQAGAPWTRAGLLVTSSPPGAEVSDWFLVDPTTGMAQALPWMQGVFDPIAWTP